jgi:hypothetical protein
VERNYEKSPGLGEEVQINSTISFWSGVGQNIEIKIEKQSSWAQISDGSIFLACARIDVIMLTPSSSTSTHDGKEKTSRLNLPILPDEKLVKN